MGNAQIIYSNAFDGGAVNIDGTVPNVANDIAGGISSATWNSVNNTAMAYLRRDGTIGITGNSILLPFAPQSGYVYTLKASVTFTSDPGNWLAMGFASYNPASNTAPDSRFNISYVNGKPWSLFRPGTANGGVQLYYSTSGLVGSRALIPATFPNTNTISIVLDTTGSNWIASEFVNGIQVGTNYAYATIPSIGAVGVGQTTLNSSTGIKWNYLTLEATGTGPTTNTINATVNFSPTNMGLLLNPAFEGLSYEKLSVANGFFTSNNAPLVKLFSMIGPAVLRIGGGTVDTTCWGGLSNTTPITASNVDMLAGFVKALPTNWSVIYGINLLSNTPANCAAEAAYVANALGSRLLGFQIGNEPEYGFPTYNAFLVRWRALAAAITNSVPGWAITNGGNGWMLTGVDAGQGVYSWNNSFAHDESGVASMLTQHYYRAAGGLPTDTMELLFQPDPYLLKILTNIVPAAATAHFALGVRMDETASYSAGGVQGVSDVYGAALWSLDFMFTAALNGCQGVNFHGGWVSPYSPIIDNGTAVMRVGPELYGLKMLSLLPHGNVVPVIVTLSSNVNFTAYGVRQANSTVSTLLNNKEVNCAVAATVNLGTNAASARLIKLTGPSLHSTSCYSLGGATINPDGSWNGGVQAVLPATNGLVTVVVPPISAFLLNPVVTPPRISSRMNGNQLTLSWATNYAGWLLESNSAGLATTNWVSVPGLGNTNRVQITIPPGQSNVFYRLALP